MPQDNLVMVYRVATRCCAAGPGHACFSGIGQFQKDFTISWKLPPKEGQPLVIDLVPKKEQAELKRLTLTINPQTYLVDPLKLPMPWGKRPALPSPR